MDENNIDPDELNDEEMDEELLDEEDEELQEEQDEKEIYLKQQSKLLSKKKRKKRRKQHFFLKAVILIVLVIALFVFLSSPFFAIDSVTSLSNKHFTEKQVVKLSGIKKGENIFALRKKVIEKRLLKDPYINAVEINKKYPRTIEIIAEERRPFATIQYGSKFALIDKDGNVLDIRKKRPKITLIKKVSVKSIKKDKPIEVKEEKLMEESMDLIGRMKNNNLFFKKIDLDLKGKAKLYIYDTLVIEGDKEPVIKNINNGNIGVIVYDLYKKKIKRGTIKVDKSGYCFFTPVFE